MSKSVLSEARFHNEDAARKHLEAIRWPDGAVCPHCGGADRNSKLEGESHRKGLYFCGDCRQQFTVTVGTVFERSKIALHKWVLATHLICASKKGMSSKQLERMLGVTYKTAWFMTHRIREAMKASGGLLGSGGKPVEADETYWGNETTKKRYNADAGYEHKMKIVSLVERGGNKRTFHVDRVNAKTLRPILQAHIAPEAHLMTDEAKVYKPIGKKFAKHSSVNHRAYEYSRGDVTTNSVESSFALLKRGLIGTFHHVGEQHIQRYATEFDFRWNHRKVTDTERTDAALRGIHGKRLTYRRTDREDQAALSRFRERN